MYVTWAQEITWVPAEFGMYDLCGDRVVGVARRDHGPSQVVVLNLSTGQVQQISSAIDTRDKYEALVSERWVIWTEESGVPDHFQWLKAYNLENDQEIEWESGTSSASYLDPSLSGDIVVFSRLRHESAGDNLPSLAKSDIVAHNLATGEEWIVAAGGFPKISGQWVIYLEPGVADRNLRAHRLDTGEDFLIGEENLAQNTDRIHHIIVGTHVIWNKSGHPGSGGLYVYDLERRSAWPLAPSSQGEVQEHEVQVNGVLKPFGETAFVLRGFGKRIKQYMAYDLDQGSLLGIIDVSALDGDWTEIYASNGQVVLFDTDAKRLCRLLLSP